MNAPEKICFVNCGLPADQCACYRHYLDATFLPTILATEHNRIVADYLAVIDHLHHEHDYWRGRAEFAEAQFEALAEMAPPPQKGLLLRRLKELAEIRAMKGGGDD